MKAVKATVRPYSSVGKRYAARRHLRSIEEVPSAAISPSIALLQRSGYRARLRRRNAGSAEGVIR